MVLRLNHLHPKKKVGSEDHDKGHSLICNEITHPLSSQQDGNGREDSKK